MNRLSKHDNMTTEKRVENTKGKYKNSCITEKKPFLYYFFRIINIAAFWLREIPRSVIRYRRSRKSEPVRPGSLVVEVTNLCNANCVFCGYQFLNRKHMFMPMDIYKSAIKQFVETGGGSLGLTPSVGEPLLDSLLCERVMYARQFKEITGIYITTNAIRLSPDLFVNLVKAGLKSFTISMSGFNADEYLRVYRTDQYQKVVENLKSIAELPEFKECTLSISLRSDSLFPMLSKEYSQFKKFGYTISSARLFDSWSGRIREKNLPNYMYLRPLIRRSSPCQSLMGSPFIRADGTVSACACRDLDLDEEMVLGNITKYSLDEIWKGKRIKELRERFRNGIAPKICQDCSFYLPSPY